jgi:serine/threonine protein kinase/predicted Zn-dependent protease
LAIELRGWLTSYQHRFGVDTQGWGQGFQDREGEVLAQADSAVAVSQRAEETLDFQATSTHPGRTTPGRFRQHAEGAFPEVGSWFGEFQIMACLGEGAFSRVYLALQRRLADRQVVLKLTSMPLGESQRLAKLQHGHIMPLYSVHRTGGLFALCMPLLGNVTIKTCLTSIGSDLSGKAMRPSSGLAFAEVICHAGPAVVEFKPQQLTELRERFAAMDYTTACLEIVRQIALGLEHAHRRGVLHRDLKPANVLLGFDGSALLLDFNLAHSPGDLSTQVMGGTIPYMSPEQLAAMQDDQIEVGPAADLYSVGLLLYEMLTGRLPFEQVTEADWEQRGPRHWIALRGQPVEPPSRLNPRIPPAVDAMVLHCLHPKVEGRYRAAGELVEDLSRQLSDLPLKFAGNPSLRERVGKFGRRHRKRLRQAAIVVTLFVLLLGSGWGYWRLRQSHLEQTAGERFSEFLTAARQAEAALLFADSSVQPIGVERALAARELYTPAPTSSGDPGLRAWVDYLSADQQREVQLQLEHLDTLLQAAITADPATAEERLAKLAENQQLRRADGLYQALADYERRDYDGAMIWIETQLAKEPGRFALRFLQGNCLYELREYQRADQAYAVACSLEPRSALALLKRALCRYQLGQLEECWQWLLQAQSLDPHNPLIFSNKALVLERQQRYGEALSEIRRSLELDAGSLRFKMIHSRLLRAAGDEEAAERELTALREQRPATPEDWIMRGIARLAQSPEAALADFRTAAESTTMAVVARQNMAHVLSERMGRPEEAIQVLTELLQQEPDFLPAQVGRAVLRARLGQIEAALQDVEACQQRMLNPEAHYQIACVYAQLSRHDQSYRPLALRHLAMALTPAYAAAPIENDADLLPLRDLSGFRLLVRGISVLKQWQED